LDSGKSLKDSLEKTNWKLQRWGRDTVLIVCQLGVSFEDFGEPLGNRRGCPDMFGFQKESGGPNLIAFLELFLWGTLRVQLGFH
jgi:hypothetical protein